MNGFVKIKEAQSSYTATEKNIAKYILENPIDTLESSAQSLGEKTKTSAAAIIRFSKKIGFSGFSDLKMNLAQSQQTSDEQLDFIINDEDDISSLVDKCCQLNMNTVLKTYQLIDIKHLKLAIEKLIHANTIYLFGVGGSAIVAHDVEQKFIRIGKKVIYNKDLHVQITFCESMSKNDVALFISYSGTTPGLLEIAKSIKKHNISIISITQFNQNPLSKISDISLVVPNEEKEIRMGAISSRISSLVVTDLLYYGVFKNDLEGNKNKLIETKKIVSTL